jgi:hypothetical protein
MLPTVVYHSPMEPVTGILRKMIVDAERPVRYGLPVGDARLDLNGLIGAVVSIRHTGAIRCIACGRKTGRSFNQGYCYPCFRSLAACDTCIVKPELCHFHEGTCREPDWALDHCMQPHVVYLANSSGLKVGITRRSQLPTRWIDQGATAALAIMEVASRFHSGLVEVTLREHVADRTDWRRMLKGPAAEFDLRAARDELLARAADGLARLRDRIGEQGLTVLEAGDVRRFDYPVLGYPERVTAFNLDREPVAGGRLLGAKGQYLIFDAGVISIRKYAGYEVELRSAA